MFGLYLYGGLIYGSPKYNEEDYSEEEDYKIALKQYYDSLELKDRIFLMKKIYVEPPKKYKVIFKLSNFALANSKSLNIGNVYWLFWFLCGNEVYTDSLFNKIVLKVLTSKHFTIS